MDKKPNIIFILIDDMGWKDLGCQGSKFYETPNIDTLAKEGMRFTRAYAACPVCSPTRASIMTGKYPARVGITQWIGGKLRGKLIGAPYLHYLPLEEKTIASALKGEGFKTYHVGKWHLGDKPYWPEHHGFDINIGGCHMGNPYSGYFSPYNIPTLENGPKGEYLTDRLTDEAIKLLEANGDSPFFLHMSYYSVHTPIQAPEENVSKFKKKASKLGLDKEQEYEDGKSWFLLENNLPKKVPHRIIQSDPVYAGMIERLDWNIGRLLKSLKKIGKEKDTIVIFFSDNGGLSDYTNAPTTNKPLRHGKSYMYEGGIREPCIIKWPGRVPKDTICESPINSTDFYPTLLECCGMELLPQQHLDGESFLGLLNDPSQAATRGPIFWHYPHYNGNGGIPATAVIDGDWKLIKWFDTGHYELFHLGDDIGEHFNLVDQYPEVVSRLKKIIQDFQDETNAKIPKPNPNYPLYLAEKYVSAKGILTTDENEGYCLKMQITPDNPNLYNVPISELIEEFLGITLHLTINGNLRTGRFYLENDGSLIFADTHEEVNLDLNDQIQEFLGKNVQIKAFQGIPTLYFDEKTKKEIERKYSQPHVEITTANIEHQ